MHSFANFGLCDSLRDFQICALYVGFPNCLEGRKRADKNYFFLEICFNY